MARFRSGAALCEFGGGFVCEANRRAQWPNGASHAHVRRAASRVPRQSPMRAVCCIAARRFARAAATSGRCRKRHACAAAACCSAGAKEVLVVQQAAAGVSRRARPRCRCAVGGGKSADPPHAAAGLLVRGGSTGLRSVGTKKPGKLRFSRLLVTLKLVGETGFEPATSTSRT